MYNHSGSLVMMYKDLSGECGSSVVASSHCSTDLLTSAGL